MTEVLWLVAAAWLLGAGVMLALFALPSPWGALSLTCPAVLPGAPRD